MPPDVLPPLATVGILSMGDMGSAIARVLVAKQFAVVTNCSGRSQDTIDRARGAGVHLYTNDRAMVGACDVLLSIVPPRDALATAQRVVDAVDPTRDESLYYIDMNAISPMTCKEVAALFNGLPACVRFVDGCILGYPPAPPTAGSSSEEWYRPLMPTSGPYRLTDTSHQAGDALVAALGMRHVGSEVGTASGLKMCFGSFSKGLTAVSVQALTSASRLGVLEDLMHALERLMPQQARCVESLVVGLPPKAYRWVREMEEISHTHEHVSGFEPDLFRAAANVFRTVAEDTDLGTEKVDDRKRGTTVEDFARAMVEGMDRSKLKTG